jgi:hypothetical protein
MMTNGSTAGKLIAWRGNLETFFADETFEGLSMRRGY